MRAQLPSPYTRSQHPVYGPGSANRGAEGFKCEHGSASHRIAVNTAPRLTVSKTKTLQLPAKPQLLTSIIEHIIYRSQRLSRKLVLAGYVFGFSRQCLIMCDMEILYALSAPCVPCDVARDSPCCGTARRRAAGTGDSCSPTRCGLVITQTKWPIICVLGSWVKLERRDCGVAPGFKQYWDCKIAAGLFSELAGLGYYENVLHPVCFHAHN